MTAANDDLAQGYKVDDIENVVLSQVNGVPVLMKDVGKVSVGYRPRLGILGRDHQDDVVGAIVVKRRTEKTADMIPKVEAAIDKVNHDGSLPPGVKVVPFYDRSSLVALTTHTVLHNLIFGCLLVFLIQWIFLGQPSQRDHRWIEHPVRVVLRHHSAGDYGRKREPAVRRRCGFRHHCGFGRHSGREHLPEFPTQPGRKAGLLQRLAGGFWGPDPTQPTEKVTSAHGWTDRLRLILISALQVDKAVLFRRSSLVAGFVPLFTMQGVEGQIFGPMARTYGYALAGALMATFTVTPVLASMLLPKRVKEAETIVVRVLAPPLQSRACVLRCDTALSWLGSNSPFRSERCCSSRRGSAASFFRIWKKAIFGFAPRCRPRSRSKTARRRRRKMREILLRHPEVITVVSQHGRPDDGSDASPFSNVELFAPLKPFDEWPHGLTKEKLTEQVQAEFNNELPGVVFNFSQYIEDNIEEGISGVKGVNSVKIVGPNLEVLTQAGRAGPRPDESGSRDCRPWHFPGSWTAEPEHQGGSCQGRALWPQFR